MTRCGLATLLFASACSSPGLQASSRRQAVELPTANVELAPATETYPSGFMDTPWPTLGTSLSACPEGGFAAGGGDFFANYLVDANDITGWVGNGNTSGSVGHTVICVDNDHWVGGGADGTYRSDDPSPLLYQPTFALTRFSTGILAGAAYANDLGCVFLLSDAGVTPLLCGDGGTFGGAIAINEDKPQLAIGSPEQDKVELFERYADGGLYLAHTIEPPFGIAAGAGFGSALAYGDVAASPGRELIIASNDGVYIYNEAPHLVLRLELPARVTNPALEGPPFSIVVERVPLGNWPVRHFWLGLPSSDFVFRCIGTSCSTFSLDDPAVTGTSFGASLAIDRTTLLVGAPGWSSGGAVFAFTVDIGGSFDGGVLQECAELGNECACGYTCVGGVVCLPNRFVTCADAGVDAGEVVDAGEEEKDAGSSRDAGSEKDAGVPDAGVVDAGVPDAGVEAPGAANFIAQGCSSSAALPLILLGLLALSRGRGSRAARGEGRKRFTQSKVING